MTNKPGEVAKVLMAVGGTAGAGGAWFLAMALARLVTTAVSAAIFCANLALDGALPAIVHLGMFDLLVFGGMVGSVFDCSRTHVAGLLA